MSSTDANIMIDVRAALGDQAGDDLISQLRAVHGVKQANISVSMPRLVLVGYDPKQVDTQRILAAVVRRGFDARLIGM